LWTPEAVKFIEQNEFLKGFEQVYAIDGNILEDTPPALSN